MILRIIYLIVAIIIGIMVLYGGRVGKNRAVKLLDILQGVHFVIAIIICMLFGFGWFMI